MSAIDKLNRRHKYINPYLTFTRSIISTCCWWHSSHICFPESIYLPHLIFSYTQLFYFYLMCRYCHSIIMYTSIYLLYLLTLCTRCFFFNNKLRKVLRFVARLICSTLQRGVIGDITLVLSLLHIASTMP